MKRQAVLDQAGAYIQKDRNSTYGEPEDNFDSIARLWRGYAYTRWGIELPIETYDVANLMILMKMARAANDPVGNYDNYVDTAGYAACAAEVAALAEQRGLSPERYIAPEDREGITYFPDN